MKKPRFRIIPKRTIPSLFNTVCVQRKRWYGWQTVACYYEEDTHRAIVLGKRIQEQGYEVTFYL